MGTAEKKTTKKIFERKTDPKVELSYRNVTE